MMELTEKLPVFDEKTFVADLVGKKNRTLRTFYAQVARVLHFPDYFGKNLDALDECLADLSWVEAENVALLVHGSDVFLNKEKPETRKGVLDIFKNLAENPGEKPLKVYFLE